MKYEFIIYSLHDLMGLVYGFYGKNNRMPLIPHHWHCNFKVVTYLLKCIMWFAMWPVMCNNDASHPCVEDTCDSVSVLEQTCVIVWYRVCSIVVEPIVCACIRGDRSWDHCIIWVWSRVYSWYDVIFKISPNVLFYILTFHIVFLYNSEGVQLLTKRWQKLEKVISQHFNMYHLISGQKKPLMATHWKTLVLILRKTLFLILKKSRIKKIKL